MKEKEFVNSNEKLIDDLVKLRSSEGVALRSGIEIDINAIYRVIGKNVRGKIIATNMQSITLTQIETHEGNLILHKRDEKKFRKMYSIISKTKLDKRLGEADNLWD